MPYTYYVKHLPTGLKYYGVCYGALSDPTKFWVSGGYFTSSKKVKALLKQDGPLAFFAEVRKVFDTKEEATAHENGVLTRLKVVEKDEWLNQSYMAGPYFARGKMSEEHKAKLSASMKGKKRPKTGPHSPEHRAKIAAALRGYVKSDEHRANLSVSHTGKVLSSEHRANLSAAKRRHK